MKLTIKTTDGGSITREFGDANVLQGFLDGMSMQREVGDSLSQVDIEQEIAGYTMQHTVYAADVPAVKEAAVEADTKESKSSKSK